jgi:hypothetical protein
MAVSRLRTLPYLSSWLLKKQNLSDRPRKFSSSLPIGFNTLTEILMFSLVKKIEDILEKLRDTYTFLSTCYCTAETFNYYANFIAKPSAIKKCS